MRDASILAMSGGVLALLLAAAGSPRAQEQDSPRAIMEKRGLLGTWAYDCGKRATPVNHYVVYRALDEQRVQRDTMHGPTRRERAGLVESAVELSPHEIQITEVLKTEKGEEVRDVATRRIEGNRQRAMEWTQNGEKHIAAGRYLKTKLNGSWGGKPTDWLYRCD